MYRLWAKRRSKYHSHSKSLLTRETKTTSYDTKTTLKRNTDYGANKQERSRPLMAAMSLTVHHVGRQNLGAKFQGVGFHFIISQPMHGGGGSTCPSKYIQSVGHVLMFTLHYRLKILSLLIRWIIHLQKLHWSNMVLLSLKLDLDYRIQA